MDLLRHVTFFVTIAEERHFGRAADRLGMTQPPLSQGLRRLESHLGARLFERNAREVTLTPAGRALLGPAETFVAAAGALRRSALEQGDAGSTVRLGVVGALRPDVVAALAAAVRETAGRGVETAVAPTVDLADRVAAGRCHLAVVRHPGVLSDLAAGPVVRLPTRLLVPADRAAGGRVRWAALRDLPLALPPRAHHPAAHDQLVDAVARRGVRPRVIAVEDDRAVLAAVAADRAFTVGPDLAPGAPGVAALDPADPIPVRVRAVWHPGTPPDEAVREAVLAVLRAEDRP
ncbi:LysR family transcriptional regulator [Actinomycetospora sp. CA-084318]|uniref:LysR family transcriptional regulator n=1 Tax=Actinomycetospora sp. CA-084318 TaxID=3239892 RepID=UPI003D972720